MDLSAVPEVTEKERMHADLFAEQTARGLSLTGLANEEETLDVPMRSLSSCRS